MIRFDEKEAERLVETYSDLILRLCFHYTKSTADAEDICQELFIKLLTRGSRFESPEHEKAWVIRAAINLCKDEFKAARRNVEPLENAADQAAYTESETDVMEAVMSLPLKYREVVYLHYYEGYSLSASPTLDSLLFLMLLSKGVNPYLPHNSCQPSRLEYNLHIL